MSASPVSRSLAGLVALRLLSHIRAKSLRAIKAVLGRIWSLAYTRINGGVAPRAANSKPRPEYQSVLHLIPAP
jgi:hypothetical protein